jgi:hypothetical protein
MLQEPLPCSIRDKTTIASLFGEPSQQSMLMRSGMEERNERVMNPRLIAHGRAMRELVMPLSAAGPCELLVA